MRILAIEHDLNVPAYANLKEINREEARAVWKLRQDDVIRDIWFTVAGRRAVMMLECADEAAARKILEALPRVRHGFSDFKLLELRSYDGFERLFATRGAAKTEEAPEY